MNALIICFLATLGVVLASGGAGVVIKGPSGVVTGHGPIGPTGPAHGGDGFYYGGFGGFGAGFPGAGHGAGVAIIGPAAPHAYVAGPAAPHAYVAGPALGGAYLAGPGAGYGGWAGYAGDGYVGYGGHGVAVRGPKTVPAVIEGPAGKVAADGLYGVPAHHY